jgi:hypothetical protein
VGTGGLERLWLDMTVPRLDGADRVLPRWQGRMIAGSYNDAAAADGLPLIGGISTYHSSGDRPDVGSLENADPPIPQPWPDTVTVSAAISQNLPKFGIQADRIAYLNLRQGSVPMVYASSGDSAALSRTTPVRIFGTGDLPGYFIHLSDARGTPAGVIGNCAIVRGGLAYNPHAELQRSPMPKPGAVGRSRGSNYKRYTTV